MSKKITKSEDLVSIYNKEYFAVKQATKQGYILCKVGGVADLSVPTSKTRRGRVQENGDICPTIMTSPNIYRLERKKNERQGNK